MTSHPNQQANSAKGNDIDYKDVLSISSEAVWNYEKIMGKH